MEKFKNLGEIKKRAKEIKTDHKMALELWGSGDYHSRMLSVLILDSMEIDQEFIENILKSINTNSEFEQTQIFDWLLANQLTKNKRLKELIKNWSNHREPLLRRLFWYFEARLRWTGKNPNENSLELMELLETKLANEEPVVQWSMNFCAGWIGIFDKDYRERCIKLGEETRLYIDEKVSKGCTPSYLPEFIRIEVKKRGLK